MIQSAPSPPFACSVIICTRNRPTELARCLDAVSKLSPGPSEVLVVDNASSDASAFEVAKAFHVRYLVEPRTGLSRARNRGAHACRNEIVAFLDDDAVPESDWLRHLMFEFEDSSVIAVAGKNRPLATRSEVARQCAEYYLPEDRRERRTVDRDTYAWFELANFGGIGDGANMAFRRHAFKIWDGFDERLGRGAPLLGGEEHYAFFSLIDCGYRVAYAPHAIIRHPCPDTLEGLRTRLLCDCTSATSYLTLILAEQPRYRLRAMRYILTGLLGISRPWRKTAPRFPLRVGVPLWQKVVAYLKGPLLYVEMRVSARENVHGIRSVASAASSLASPVVANKFNRSPVADSMKGRVGAPGEEGANGGVRVSCDPVHQLSDVSVRRPLPLR
jgi:glycosyltransferase involved in cell wall biosynthesis